MPEGSQFSPEQAAELRSLGVSKRQLEELEFACRTCRYEMPPLHPLNDSRAELSALAASVRAAKTSIERINAAGAGRQKTPRWEAFSWLSAAHRWGAFEGGNLPQVDLRETEQRLADILSVAEAVLSLPVEPRRRRVSIWPGYHVDLALKDAWVSERNWNLKKSTAEELLTDPSDPYPFRPSISPTSPFALVMSVFLEALTGRKDINPERYLRVYLAWLKLNGWRALGIVPGNA